ncbi:MAG: thiol peroxidase [Planctomycetes bacterium]|nr:thiol peroxidase [Planctomycetota bacterium]
MARQCTLKGKPLRLDGPQLKPGDKAPDATLKKSLVDSIAISATHGKTRIFSVVPSLDTPVCALQTKRFNEEAAKLANVDFFTISADLPTAQARFCGAENINRERLQVLSDHLDTSFGRAYGTLIPDLRVECRAVFVVDKTGVIRHAEYVPEVADHPNYDAALACARQLA